jgi:hypothetical protein
MASVRLGFRTGHGGSSLRTGQHLATGGQPTSGVMAAVCQANEGPHAFGPAMPGLPV